MANSTKPLSDEPTPDLQTILGDVAALKHDLAELMRHVKLGATDGARALANEATDGARAFANGAADRVRDDAQQVYDTLAVSGRRSVKAVARNVEERPIASLLIAFAIGFIGSRFLPR